MEDLLFGQRYRVIEKIGTGGMADVYKAVDEVLGRTVAVKVMHRRLAADPSFAARFRQEAQAAANLVSPNIVNMYDWGQDDGTFYIVMEHVRGTDLKSIIEQKGPLPSRTVAEIGAQVCSALSVAHGYDVIHRDIKPHNIMVQPDGAVTVMDFGIARAGTSMMTQTGLVLGTAQYLSPEAALGTPLTAASDLYSLGIVLYEAATGRVPFDADTPVAVALKQVNEQAVPPQVANPDIDPALGAVIVKAMQKKTTDRYVSADDLRRDLVAVAQGPPFDSATELAGMVAGGVSAGPAPRVAETAVMPRVSGPGDGARDWRPKPRAVPRRRAAWRWVVLAVLLVAAGLGVVWGAGLRGGEGASVPEVRAMTRADAEAALRRAGFTVGVVTEAFSETVKSGTVVGQSPKPDATAGKGSAVDLVLSRGQEMVAVPNVVDMLEADAFATLEKAGFSPQALPSQFNSDVPANIVYEQTPSGEETAARGSIVTYVISRGPDPGVRGRGEKPGKSKSGVGRP